MTDLKQAPPQETALPCPLCHSSNIGRGFCFIDGPRQDAMRCRDCGCRATKAAWDSRTPAAGAPSDDFIDAFLKADGSWVEAYEAPRESGVAVDMDMPQIDADEFNAEARESFRSAWIAASGSHSPAGKAPVSYEAFSGAMHECNKLKEEVERLRVKPTDANVPVLIEALYRCGCPVAINTTVGECAERGCGCSINAERLKGCMEGGHTTSLPSTEGSST